jgi:RimJ/RimL family protein N-acetyltransferase
LTLLGVDVRKRVVAAQYALGILYAVGDNVPAELEPFAEMNADPEAMRYFPALLTKDESAASMERQPRAIDQRGWGLWAVDVDGVFAGFTGLNVPSFSAPFTPRTEIGWRFRREFWGRGLA